jgi:hypothetical protein
MGEWLFGISDFLKKPESACAAVVHGVFFFEGIRHKRVPGIRETRRLSTILIFNFSPPPGGAFYSSVCRGVLLGDFFGRSLAYPVCPFFWRYGSRRATSLFAEESVGNSVWSVGRGVRSSLAIFFSSRLPRFSIRNSVWAMGAGILKKLRPPPLQACCGIAGSRNSRSPRSFPRSGRARMRLAWTARNRLSRSFSSLIRRCAPDFIRASRGRRRTSRNASLSALRHRISRNGSRN